MPALPPNSVGLPTAKRASILVVTLLLLCPGLLSRDAHALAFAQASEQKGYANDADGLRLLLDDMLRTARGGDRAKLVASIKETEIPNHAEWFAATFGHEKGEGWAESYGKGLQEQESDFADMLSGFSHANGAISVQKLDPKKIYDSLRAPLDLYLADWVPASADGSSTPQHVGYFDFVEGKFRWDSTVVFARPSAAASSGNTADTATQNAHGSPPSRVYAAAVTFATCAYCPTPEYSKEGRKAKFNGTITMKATIQPDGTATNIEVVKSSQIPSQDEKAVETLRQWRFKPAVDRDGNPVPYTTAINMTFVLK